MATLNPLSIILDLRILAEFITRTLNCLSSLELKMLKLKKESVYNLE